MLLSDVLNVADKREKLLHQMNLLPPRREPRESPCTSKRHLTAAEADRLCNTMTPDALLCELNEDRPPGRHLVMEGAVKKVIEYLVAREYDFGIAAAFFRLVQGENFFLNRLEDFFHTESRSQLNWQRPLGEGLMGVDGGGQEAILDPYEVKPRRIWDLYSNRVIPFFWFWLIHSRDPAAKQQEPTPTAIGQGPPSTASDGFLGNIKKRQKEREDTLERHLRAMEGWFESLQDYSKGKLLQIQGKPDSSNRVKLRETAPSVAKIMRSAFIEDRQEVLNMQWRAEPEFWAISHSWANEDERIYVNSPINQHLWPIPIPETCELEDVRKAAIESGSEYCWLDVLCLRQYAHQGKGPGNEWVMTAEDDIKNEVRAEEIKIDVPTIGNVYRKAFKILYYFNNLGRPLVTDGVDFKNPRHWLNRAWTLQEVVDPRDSVCVADGITGELCDLLQHTFERVFVAPAQIYPIERWKNLQWIGLTFTEPYIVPLLQEMNRRDACNETDRICGLGYLLRIERMPPYLPDAQAEAVWKQLLMNMDYRLHFELLFLFPYTGPDTWMPTWERIRACPDELEKMDNEPVEYLARPKVTANCKRFTSAVYLCIQSVLLYKGSSQGSYRLKYSQKLGLFSTEVEIIVSDRKMEIPDGEYCILVPYAPMRSNLGLLCKKLQGVCEDHTAVRKITPVKVLGPDRWKKVRLGGWRNAAQHVCFS